MSTPKSRLPLVQARHLFEKIEKADFHRWPKGSARGGQFAPSGAGDAGKSGDLFASSSKGAHGVLPKGAALHAKPDDLGNAVVVHHPTPASSKTTWHDPSKVATFVPGGKHPDELNGVPMKSWTPPVGHAGWKKVAGTNEKLEANAPFMPHPTKYTAAGVVIEEPDGRVWLTKPTNHFGGYLHTYPKGTAEPGLTLQQNAVKEAYEETGLKVKITGVLGDYERDTSKARIYTAKRVGGTPKDMGWESQALRLVPREQLHDFLNREHDKGIASDYAWDVQHPVKKAFNPEQARWPKGSPLAGQWKSTGADGFTAPPKIGSATNPKYAKIAENMHKAAQAGDWAHVKASVDALGAKVATHGAKEKLNSHDKWTAQAHQYGEALLAEKEHKTSAVASAAKITGPDKLSGWTKVGAKPGGSSDGALYKDPKGQTWLVKSYGDDDMAKSEVLASHLLKAAGAGAAEMKLVDLGDAHKGGLGVASKMLTGHDALVHTNPQHKAAAQKDFAAHAWLANWDSIGLSHDNTVIHEGKAVNIDPGGALDYRAQGGKKGKAFGTSVDELDTMRDKSLNPSAKSVYGSMTKSDMQHSAIGVLSLPHATIAKLVNTYGPGTAADKKALTEKLVARQNDLAAKLGMPTGEQMKAAIDKGPTVATTATAASKDAAVASQRQKGASNTQKIASEPAASVSKPGKTESKPAKPEKPAFTFEAHKLLATGVEEAHAKGDAGTIAEVAHAFQNNSGPAGKQLHAYAVAMHEHLTGHAPEPAKTAFAVPEKPTKLSSAANPNKGLIAKVDAMHETAVKFAAGELTKEAALEQIQSHTFGTNTFGKTAGKYQSDLVAAMVSGSAETAKADLKQLHTAAQKAAGQPSAAKPAAPKPKPFDPAKISAPPNFLSWGTTGKPGPSSKAAVNEANAAGVAKVYEAAKTGKPEAVDAVKLPVVADAAGTIKHVSPIDHPSQHIKGYAQQVKNEIDYQLNPPKKFRLGEGNPLNAIDKAHPAIAGGSLASAKALKKIGGLVLLGNPGHFDTAALEMPHITYKNGKLTTTTFRDAAMAAWAKMPKTQRDAVKSYTGSGYSEINKSLWSGNPSGAAKSAGEAIMTLGHEIPAGTVLSRKVTASDENGLKALTASVGKVIQEPAVMSTSISPGVWSGNIHLKLTVGPGVKGLYVGEQSMPGGGSISHFKSEKEVLLPPNTRLLIQKVEVAPKGGDADGFGNGPTHIVHALVLPTHASDVMGK